MFRGLSHFKGKFKGDFIIFLNKFFRYTQERDRFIANNVQILSQINVGIITNHCVKLTESKHLNLIILV